MFSSTVVQLFLCYVVSYTGVPRLPVAISLYRANSCYVLYCQDIDTEEVIRVGTCGWDGHMNYTYRILAGETLFPNQSRLEGNIKIPVESTVF
jgi:hypothetical protein